MALVSGLGARLGLGVEWSYLLWKPVAALALFGGFAAYLHRFLAGRWQRLAALVLALFFFSPFVLLESGGEAHALAGELMTAGLLWGYLPSVLSVALMPVFLLGLERLASADERPSRVTIALVSGCGLLVSWLHPWQGEVLLLIVGGLVAWARLDIDLIRRLALPAAATVVPLAYYFLLGVANSAWALARDISINAPDRPLWALAVAVLPLAVPALLGVRGPAQDVGERALRLWPAAALGVFVLTPSFPEHALAGVSLPLAVMAVRGMAPLLSGRRVAAALSAIGVAALALVGPLNAGDAVRDSIRDPVQPVWTTDDERASLDWLADQPGEGGVLTTPFLAPAVPALTGRWVRAGHPSWTQDYHARVASANALFDGRLSAAQARALIDDSGVTWVVADCSRRGDLRRMLGDAVTGMWRFGCATVYRVDQAS
jgi:hypothetical protein